MTHTTEDATLIVELLGEAGLSATLDPRSAVGMLPCVLIGPPRIEFSSLGGPTYRWRLIVLAADPSGSLHSWEQMDAIIEVLNTLLPIEAADPITYALPAAGSDPLPAYAVTLTGS
jgi:hypothetical protein